MTVLEDVRAIGVAMGSCYRKQEIHAQDENGEDVQRFAQRFVGWTTDEAKAEAAREAGATVTHYRSHDGECDGWDVSVVEITERAD